MKAASLFSAIFLLAVGLLHARDYQILSGGGEKVFRLGEREALHEILPGGEIGEPLEADPRVVLRAARVVEVPELARRVQASGWSQASIGGFYNLEFSTVQKALEAAEILQTLGHEASLAMRRQKHSRFTPRDPFFKDQWNLRNTGQRGGTKGIDLNVGTVWKSWRGKGISVAVIDDGLEVKHPDLSANCFTLASKMHYDFNSGDRDPSPSKDDYHGTAVAGVVAARSNSVGGLGVAPEAKLVGLRLTAGPSDGEMEAKAFSWKNSAISVYNNSWGPADDGIEAEGPDAIAREAIVKATKFGRSGRGSIFVWACGNGRPVGDDSNYDGYANLPQTIAVGAVGDRGSVSSDSEMGANIVVVAPSSSHKRQGLVSTDLSGRRGYNVDGQNDGLVVPAKNFSDLDYTNDFGMTSGATPQVSGVVALMLQANPKLGWRDVQEILIRSARRVSASDADWKRNGAGLFFNHKFGAGMVDALAAVKMSLGWKNLAAATSVSVPLRDLSLQIPDNKPGGATVEFDLSDVTKHAVLHVEHAVFTVSARHPWRGDLKFVLVSPSGMQSVVASRNLDDGRAFSNWSFMSVRHWGENSAGVWKLKVIDTFSGDSGRLTGATLTLLGTRKTAIADP